MEYIIVVNTDRLDRVVSVSLHPLHKCPYVINVFASGQYLHNIESTEKAKGANHFLIV